MSTIILSDETKRLVKEITKGHNNIKLTIGVLQGEEKNYYLFDDSGLIPYEEHWYEIGSVGKVFTTSLFAKYLKNNDMNLDDDLTKYIPSLKSGIYPTLKQLATHTAGYPTRYPMSKKDIFNLAKKQLTGKKYKLEDYLYMDYKKMIDLIENAKLKDKEYAWNYSNFGISLLGHCISVVGKESFWELMNDFIKTDLGLDSTVMGTGHPKLLNGYGFKNIPLGNWGLGSEDYLTPAGNITSSAEDLLTFAKMNINETPDYLNLCHVFYDMKSKHSNMGLGWWIDYKKPHIYYHGGRIGGFSTMLGFDKLNKNAVVILANIPFLKNDHKLMLDVLNNL